MDPSEEKTQQGEGTFLVKTWKEKGVGVQIINKDNEGRRKSHPTSK